MKFCAAITLPLLFIGVVYDKNKVIINKSKNCQNIKSTF